MNVIVSDAVRSCINTIQLWIDHDDIKMLHVDCSIRPEVFPCRSGDLILMLIPPDKEVIDDAIKVVDIPQDWEYSVKTSRYSIYIFLWKAPTREVRHLYSKHDEDPTT